jgi:hypothetical protein
MKRVLIFSESLEETLAKWAEWYVDAQNLFEHNTRANTTQDYYRSPERSNTIDKNETGTEMTSRHRHTKSLGHVETTEADASGVGRSNSKSLKSRLGSIRRRKHHVEA